MSVTAPNRESVLLDVAVPPRPRAPRFLRKPRRSVRILLVVLAALFLFDYGLSLLFEAGWLHRSLTLRLEAAFGRPVEVSNYSFSLLEGPRLEANYITVADDPRFGHEYFLRADRVAVSLRWSELLRGRMELGALSITKPSLNLVRLPNGEWNLESWLPRPGVNSPLGPAGKRASARPQRIDVSSGRINFKEADTKLPFAFVGVDGSVEETAPGTWRLNLRAQPFRAAVGLQQAGELSLTGVLGGTSSRLRPASLELDWRAASLSDVLRLFRGYDYGMRGLFSLQLNARTQGYDWDLSSAAQFRSMHRWDLPLQADGPAANLNLQATWHPSEARLDLARALIEMPRSNIRASGAMTFAPSATPEQPSIKDEHLEISSGSIVLADVLSWYHAFHRNVAEQFEVHGSASVHLAVAGWPPRVETGEIASAGIEADGGSTPVQMRMEKASLVVTPGSITLEPVIFSAGSGSGQFRLQASMQRSPEARAFWKLSGRTSQVRSLFSAADALGFNLPPGWLLEGPAECNLQWAGNPWPRLRNPSGTMTLAGLKVHTPFLNRDLTQIKASISLSSQGTKVQLASAKAFAADWHGSLEKTAATGDWIFTLAADELSAAEMDRWLNPQRRENLLDRILPFLTSPPHPQPTPLWLRGHGVLSVGQFDLTPFQFRQFRADAAIDGRLLKLTDAQAGFYGGELSGSMSLDLASQPSYDVSAKFLDVNLVPLAAHTFSLSDLFAGTASGELHITAKGLGREALLQSLACDGQAQGREVSYSGIDLVESMRADERRPGITTFPRVLAEFSCVSGRVNFSRLQLLGPRADVDAAGYVDFQRRIAIDLSLAAPLPVIDPPGIPSPAPSPVSSPAKDPPAVQYRLTGSLNSPAIARTQAHAPLD